MLDLIGNDLLIVTSDLIELKLILAFQSDDDEDSWNQEEKLLTHATDVCSWISVFSYCWRNTCKRNPWQMKTDPEIWTADRPVDHSTGRFSTLLFSSRDHSSISLKHKPVETESDEEMLFVSRLTRRLHIHICFQLYLKSNSVMRAIYSSD